MPGKKYPAIILSAGRSTRMGAPKFSLKFDEKSTFLEKMVSTFTDYGCSDIILVLNNEGASYFAEMKEKLPSSPRIAVNSHPEWERFFSLKTGVKALGKISPVFITNIDNPFFSNAVLDLLAQHIEENDYVFPVFKGKGGHPFMISEKVVSAIMEEPNDQLNMRYFLNGFPKSGVDVNDEKVLLNINTPDDYRRIMTEFRSVGGK